MTVLARAYPNPDAQLSLGGARARVFAFVDRDLLLVDDRLPSISALGEAGGPTSAWLHLGELHGDPCFALDVAASDVQSHWKVVSLRSAYRALAEDEWNVAAYAVQLLHWQRTARFCIRCGGALESVPGEWSKRCPSCAISTYPPVSPCVIALVHDGDRVLMVHQPAWGPMHGLVAGFVEPGESLEACVRREVLEEVGLAVDGIQYFGSQTWPFPHQIMVAFMARYVRGEIVVQESELDGAAWFDRNAMPQIPPRLSIGRAMLESWMAGRAPEQT